MKMSKRSSGGGPGCLIVIIVTLIVIGTTAMANAGIFGKGKVFPLVRNRVIINERPATPATPNHPPIITVAPPVPTPILQNDDVIFEKIIARAEELMEESNKVLISPPKPSLPVSNPNPMLPIGGAAAGALAMLLAYLRNAYSFIKG